MKSGQCVPAGWLVALGTTFPDSRSRALSSGPTKPGVGHFCSDGTFFEGLSERWVEAVTHSAFLGSRWPRPLLPRAVPWPIHQTHERWPVAVLQRHSKASASARVHDGIKARPRGLLLGGALRALLSPEGAAGPPWLPGAPTARPRRSPHRILATSEVAFRRPQTGLRRWAPPGPAPEKAPPSLGSPPQGEPRAAAAPLASTGAGVAARAGGLHSPSSYRLLSWSWRPPTGPAALSFPFCGHTLTAHIKQVPPYFPLPHLPSPGNAVLHTGRCLSFCL